ncbi:MAG: hypothetical protein FWF71_01110 [Actinomycetia bacterium]|nr:hypothetical protein [Actinomycetes bacterium]
MDIEALIEEVVCRLLEKIRQEQGQGGDGVFAGAAPHTGAAPIASVALPVFAAAAAPAAANAAPGVVGTAEGGGQGAKLEKALLTQDKAMAIAKGSKLLCPKGTIVTPLANDVLKERGVRIEFE